MWIRSYIDTRNERVNIIRDRLERLKTNVNKTNIVRVVQCDIEFLLDSDAEFDQRVHETIVQFKNNPNELIRQLLIMYTGFDSRLSILESLITGEKTPYQNYNLNERRPIRNFHQKIEYALRIIRSFSQ